MSLMKGVFVSLMNRCSETAHSVVSMLPFFIELNDVYEHKNISLIDEVGSLNRKQGRITLDIPFTRKCIVFNFKKRERYIHKRSQENSPFNDRFGSEVRVALERIAQNPILERTPERDWEAIAVFNTAALYLEGAMHFVYRAIGANGLSTLGYASSKDGIHIDERFPEPVYPPAHFSMSTQYSDKPHEARYQSGVNWAGCEDARLSVINDTIFMTYTAFDGVHAPSVSITSIAVKNFLNKQWNWAVPISLSPIGECHKNWVVFPEKINNKYCILHGISPEILIEYCDTLNADDDISIRSHYQVSGDNGRWDNWLRGAGPPPLKTPEGWLLLYHAMDKRDPDRYKIGVMMLDLLEPTKVLYRLPYPLLEPDARYENDGHKSGVVYCCGAAIVDNTLFVYYGGADTVICGAVLKLNQLIAKLKQCRTSEQIALDQSNFERRSSYA